MSRQFTSKPCPGCGLNAEIAPNTVCPRCAEAIRDYRRVKSAAEAVEGSAFYSLTRGILPISTTRMAGAPAFQEAFVDLMRALCVAKPKADVGHAWELDTDYSSYGTGTRLPEPLAFLATGAHDSKQCGIRGAIHRLFHAVDELIRQATAKGKLEGQDLLGQLSSGEVSVMQFNAATLDANHVIRGRR